MEPEPVMPSPSTAGLPPVELPSHRDEASLCAHRCRQRHVLEAALTLALLSAGCNGAPECYGDEVRVDSAVSLAALDLTPGADVVVHGIVAEVCRSSGCWFILQQVDGRRLHELYIDLKGAPFTLRPDSRGRMAVVAGRLLVNGRESRLRATGLVLYRGGTGSSHR